MEEIIPGVSIEHETVIPDEFTVAQQNAARRQQIDDERYDQRRKQVLAKARHTLLNLGEPFEIDEEVVELELVEEVKALRLEADMIWKFAHRFLGRDDQFDPGDYENFL